MTEDDQAQRLAAARARVEKAARALDNAIAERDAAVLEARAAGWTLRRIAELAGVNWARVRQIERKHKGD